MAEYLKEHEGTAAGAAVIVINEDEVTYRMIGFADRERQIAVDEETVFEWGSVSKLLVWISVFQLAEAGEIHLDKDIDEYLPADFRSKTSDGHPVTMNHLMNHTAGFDDSYTDLMVLEPSEKASLREVLEAADVRQVFPPGQVTAYSNYGAGLAAYIVEEVSGLDFGDYVRSHIFEPLQMMRTAIDPEQDDNQWVKKQRRKIQGYTEDRQLIEPNRYVIPMYPAGSVTGIASDLQKLMQALLSEDGTPLFKQKETIESLFRPSLFYPGTDVPRIANGLFFLPSASGSTLGHGGNTLAFSSSIYVDRAVDTGVLVMTNTAYESALTLGIPELVFGEPPVQNRNQPLEMASKWSGIYEPARVPRHGFSKVYGLFLRSKAEPAGAHGLTMKGLQYTQTEPGVYVTEDDFSAFALDVYSTGPEGDKLLSSGVSDLLYIPRSLHVFQWATVVLAALAGLFSFGFVIVLLLNRKRNNRLLLVQNGLNVLVGLNVVWIVYKAGSMTTYSAIQPFLAANLLYVAGSTFLGCCMLVQLIRNRQIHQRERLLRILTLITAVVLGGNLLYWEFYL
ncbi:serine hydrolase domain-containing protein [Edaphobacillus lindanitolerans]|uniref:serine hydrolase domain-containing protein n=1 Tax=Edaphobacillus lindanitolerans TaxID=550447 RepID=UPI001F28AADF|nr:serine hydrolase domain-containing protein [Edaphobacillus lindanitolerans]